MELSTIHPGKIRSSPKFSIKFSAQNSKMLKMQILAVFYT